MDILALTSSPATPKSTISVICKAINCILEPPTPINKKPGYLYATQEAESGLIKIGYSTDPKDRRPEALRKCKLDFSQVYYTRLFKWAFKCEQILLKVLAEFVRPYECHCGVKHREWYKLDFLEAISAISIVMKWSLLIPEPYEKLPGNPFSAKLTQEWVDRLKIFEDSQATDDRLEWLQFFDWKILSQSVTSLGGQLPTLSSPSPGNSILRSIRYGVPTNNSTPSQNTIPTEDHRSSNSSKSPSQISSSPASDPPSSIDHPGRIRQPDGPQTVPTDKHTQRDWNAVTESISNENDLTAISTSHSISATVPASAGAEFDKPQILYAIAETKPTSRLLAGEFRKSQVAISALDTSLSAECLDITQINAESADVSYTRSKRGVITSADGLNVPYAEHESVVGTISNRTLKHQALTDDIEPNGNSMVVSSLLSGDAAIGQSIDHDHLQNEGPAKQLEQGPNWHNDSAHKEVGHDSARDERSENENDGDDSKSVFMTAPTSPAEQRVPDSRFLVSISNGGSEPGHGTPPGEASIIQLSLTSLSNANEKSITSHISTPSLSLAPFPLSMLESLDQLQYEPLADWQDTPSRRRALSSPPSPSSTIPQFLMTPPIIMNRPVEPDEIKLIQTFTALDISDGQPGDQRKNVTSQATPAKSSSASHDNQPNVATIDESLPKARRSSDPETLAVPGGAKLVSAAVSPGLLSDGTSISNQGPVDCESSGRLANAFAIPSNFEFSWSPPHGSSGAKVQTALYWLSHAVPSNSERLDFTASAPSAENISASDNGLLRPLQTDHRRRSSAPSEGSSENGMRSHAFGTKNGGPANSNYY